VNRWLCGPATVVSSANGSLTGYAGGLHRKKWLLELEQPVRQVWADFLREIPRKDACRSISARVIYLLLR
jgi:hypothetical protein